MKIYIIEDDSAVISILENIIERNGLGEVCGDTEGKIPDEQEIIMLAPDIILVDFLMPDKDGVHLVRDLKRMGCRSKFIMISQVSDKRLIEKAYDAGVDFFISKPINVIEVNSVISNVAKQLENERTLLNIRSLFSHGQTSPVEVETKKSDFSVLRYQTVLSQLGMSGERGNNDIIALCRYLHEHGLSIGQTGVSQILRKMTDSPANMEQRIRRAIAVGMSNLAHLGIEDFMNEVFVRYSGRLFAFEEIKAEMDYIRGDRARSGKVNVRKFIGGLMLICDQD